MNRQISGIIQQNGKKIRCNMEFLFPEYGIVAISDPLPNKIRHVRQYVTYNLSADGLPDIYSFKNKRPILRIENNELHSLTPEEIKYVAKNMFKVGVNP